MSLLQALRPLRTPIVWSRIWNTPQARTFIVTPARYIKETADRSPEELEKKKQEQVKKAERGEGEWHESLASDGESNIAADKEEVKDHDEHIEDLQKETVKKT